MFNKGKLACVCYEKTWRPQEMADITAGGPAFPTRAAEVDAVKQRRA